MPTYSSNIFITLSGGLKIKEPTLDLAVIASMISSIINKPIPKNIVFIGEVALTGRIKAINEKELINQSVKAGKTEIISKTQGYNDLRDVFDIFK